MPRRSTIPAALPCCLAGLLGLAGVARAGPPLLPPPPGGVVVRWQAPAGCPSEEVITTRVRGLLGAAPLDLDAIASVQRQPGVPREQSWRLELKMQWAGGSDERVLFARDCPALADATIVLVAVLAAPLVNAPRLASEPVVAPPVVAELPVEPVESLPIEPVEPAADVASSAIVEPTRAPEVITERRRGAFMRVAGVLGYGFFASGDFGVALAAGGLLRRLRIEGELTFLPARARSLSDGTGGTMALAAAAVRVCPRFRGPALELAVCGAVEAGGSWSRTSGLTPARGDSGPWLAFALGGALDWWFSPQVGLHLGVDGLGAPVVTSYVLGPQPLFEPRRFLVRGAIGLIFSLGSWNPGRPEKQRR